MFGITRRTNNGGPSRSATAGLEFIFSSQDPDQCPARTKSQSSPRPACRHHRKEGEWPGRSRPRCCARRFSGSDWHTVSAHCRSRYGGLMEGPRPSCRAMSSARARIRQSRRRQFAGSEAVELFGLRGAAPYRNRSLSVRRQQFGNHTFSLPVPLTNRKSFCRKFVPGKEEGRSEHERPGHPGKRSPIPHHRVVVPPNRDLPAAS
jgi:hypothetical protein